MFLFVSPPPSWSRGQWFGSVSTPSDETRTLLLLSCCSVRKEFGNFVMRVKKSLSSCHLLLSVSHGLSDSLKSRGCDRSTPDRDTSEDKLRAQGGHDTWRRLRVSRKVNPNWFCPSLKRDNEKKLFCEWRSLSDGFLGELSRTFTQQARPDR